METIWNDISKKAGELAGTVGKKAEKLSGIAKLKYNIVAKEGKLEKMLESVGRLRYDEFKNGSDNTEAIDALLAEALELDAEIEELKAAFNTEKGSKVCANCGAKLAKDAKFCHNCATPVEDDEPAEEPKEAEEEPGEQE